MRGAWWGVYGTDREDFPRNEDGTYQYRCPVCGIPYYSQREADLCLPVEFWDNVYGPDAFLHENNNFDQMYRWKDPDDDLLDLETE